MIGIGRDADNDGRERCRDEFFCGCSSVQGGFDEGGYSLAHHVGIDSLLVCGFVRGFAGILDADVAGKIGAACPSVADTEPFVAVLAPGTDGTALT